MPSTQKLIAVHHVWIVAVGTKSDHELDSLCFSKKIEPLAETLALDILRSRDLFPNWKTRPGETQNLRWRIGGSTGCHVAELCREVWLSERMLLWRQWKQCRKSAWETAQNLTPRQKQPELGFVGSPTVPFPVMYPKVCRPETHSKDGVALWKGEANNGLTPACTQEWQPGKRWGQAAQSPARPGQQKLIKGLGQADMDSPQWVSRSDSVKLPKMFWKCKWDAARILCKVSAKSAYIYWHLRASRRASWTCFRPAWLKLASVFWAMYKYSTHVIEPREQWVDPEDPDQVGIPLTGFVVTAPAVQPFRAILPPLKKLNNGSRGCAWNTKPHKADNMY